MKILKHKNIMQIIYGVLLLMPFLAILGRTGYVVVNKNAYQSYSEVKSIQTSENYQSVIGNTYIINWVDDTEGQTNNTTAIIPYQNITLDNVPDNAVKFRYGQTKRINFFDESNNNLGYLDDITTFTYVANDTTTLATQPWFNRQLVIYSIGKLDNVFEYSVSQFTEDNNFGRLDLSSWFTDMFLDDNAHNNLYVNFVNWYLNYAMLVSLMHFLFLVLMWFVNYSRRLLERGMNYDW